MAAIDGPVTGQQTTDEQEPSAILIWIGAALIWIGAIGIYALHGNRAKFSAKVHN
jgi:hypothetical protein